VPEQGRGGGFHTFFKNVVASLYREKGEDTLVIFANSVLAADLRLDTLRGAEVVVPPLPPYRDQWIFRILWTHVLLPVYALRKHLDVLYFPFDYGSLYSPVPSVVTIHDLIDLYYLKEMPNEGKRFRMMYSYAMKWMSLKTKEAIVAVSEETKREIEEHLHSGRKGGAIKVIREGVGEAWFEAARYRTADGAPYIFSILSTSKHKNFDGLLEAYRLIRDRRAAAVGLVIAGMGGQSDESTMEEVARHPYRKDIRLLGFVGEAELIPLMANARVFAFVSKKEGFGLPVLEAMAAGVPVVTSSVSSMPEVAADAALLVDPYDPIAIGGAIESILYDKELSARLVAKGLKRARQFTWDETGRELLAIFREYRPLPHHS